jgi:hypothetical protein
MKLHKINLILLSLISAFLVIFVSICIAASFGKKPTLLWQYQCIDTMKISRDQAQSEQNNPQSETEIAHEMKIIKQLGANCVAIDTPYDEAFVPYLKLWVKQARQNNLHIWFRGNFSSWEGWFNYPKGMTTQEHLAKTKQFILSHADLFADGDIFTPAPEAENGWGNGYVPQSDYPIFRQFLIDEHTNAQDTFNQIGKKVATNWLSMSGGLAMSMLDEPTIQALDNTVTIDHYVNSPEEMKSYIDYFNQKFHAKVILGEFGAPIPDINGNMTTQQQASFVNNIFQTLYQEHTAVYAVNYWVLRGGSTALATDTDVLKPVATTINNYYHPVSISGTITDETGMPVENASISIDHEGNTTTTNNQGYYSFLVPAKTIQLTVTKNGYTSINETVFITNRAVKKDSILKAVHPDLLYTIRKMLSTVLQPLIHIFK